MRKQNKMGPQNLCLRLRAFDELVSMLSESALPLDSCLRCNYRPDALDGLQSDHVYIVFSYCMYVDAVWIPIP